MPGPCRSRRLRGARAAIANSGVRSVVAISLLAGCAVEVETSQVWQASTVEDHVATACSTSVVLELSLQIAEEVDCMMPGQLVPLEEGNGIVFTGAAVLPYMDEEARTDLLAAAAENAPIELNSAFRTVAQQYLLRRWFEAGRCSITAAAEPGESNHEDRKSTRLNSSH